VSAGESRELNEALDQMVAKMAAVLRHSHGVPVTDAAVRADDAAARTTTAAEQACAMALTLQDSMDGIDGFIGRIGEISADIDALAPQTGVLA